MTDLMTLGRKTYSGRILIVDDDADFAQSLKLILEIDNYKILVASNEITALNLMREFDPHVVLMDIRLSDSNGIDLVAKAKSIKPEVFCIMVTAYGSIETAVSAMRQGAFDYLVKPFSPTELLIKVGRCLENIKSLAEKLKLEEDLTHQIYEKIRVNNDKNIAENIISEIEQQISASFYQAAIGIGHLSVNGAWLLVNHKLCSILGYTQQEILQKNFRDLLHPENLQAGMAMIKHLLSGEKIYINSKEIRLICEDGNYIWVDMNLSVVRSHSKEPLYLVFFIENITERKRAEEKLRMLASQLEENKQDLEDLTFSSYHHLQEPLNNVIASSELLEQAYDNSLKNEELKILKGIQNSAQVMKNLIKDLQEFSKITSNPPITENIDLATVVAKVLSDFKSEIEKTQTTVEVKNLPKICADPHQMQKLFENLIDNSIKFHKEDTPSIIVIESSYDSSGFWEITLQDNGIGIDEKYLSDIFKPFGRLADQNEIEGTGIGLAICRKILQRHWGKITAQSEPDKGTLFTITLPEQMP